MNDVTFGRYIGRCPNKKCRKVHTAPNPSGLSGRMRRTGCDCHPKQTIWMEPVCGVHSATKCGARCTNAVGPACDCSCGGENHGSGH